MDEKNAVGKFLGKDGISITRNLVTFIGSDWHERKELSVAQNEDEIFIQMMMLISLNRVHDFADLIPEYFKKGLIGKEKVKMLCMVIMQTNLFTALETLVFLKADEVNVFSFDEILEFAKDAPAYEGPNIAFGIIELFERRKEKVPTEWLRTWANEFVYHHYRGDSKKVALILIELFHRGDEEVIKPELMVSYLLNVCQNDPHSHGLPRILSLLGFAERERNWDLSPYISHIAECLLKLFVGGLKWSHQRISERGEGVDVLLQILFEILGTYNDEKFTRSVMIEFGQMTTAYRINFSEAYEACFRYYEQGFKNR